MQSLQSGPWPGLGREAGIGRPIPARLVTCGEGQGAREHEEVEANVWVGLVGRGIAGAGSSVERQTSRIPSPSQARQGSLPGFEHQKKSTRATNRFRQENRLRQEVDFLSHYKRRSAVRKSMTEVAILRRRRTTISARFFTQGK